jgi:hypothetical protein
VSDIYKTAPVPTPAESYEIGREHGKAAERKRIIKLLESLYCGKHESDKKCDLYPNYETCYVIDDAIALIKGENK